VVPETVTGVHSELSYAKLYENAVPLPALLKMGMAKCTFRFPRFTVSNGPPPKLPNAGVPVATCPDAILVPRMMNIATSHECSFMIFSSCGAMRFS
jgi:hypothetical protein